MNKFTYVVDRVEGEIAVVEVSVDGNPVGFIDMKAFGSVKEGDRAKVASVVLYTEEHINESKARLNDLAGVIKLGEIEDASIKPQLVVFGASQ